VAFARPPSHPGGIAMKHPASPILVAVISACMIGSMPLLSKDSAPGAGADPLARFMTGSRSCTGQSQSPDMKSMRNSSGKYTAERTLDGHWVVIHYQENASAQIKQPFQVIQYFGYDANKKQYLAIAVYNAAGMYTVGTSAGWQGDSITFDEGDGDASHPPMFRDTFTAAPDGLAKHTGMMRDQSGKWVKTDEETCNKPA
jgi:hypothetical protein